MSGTNFHQLYIFSYVARLRSFSKAAETLYISQPAVSNQVKLLERQYGQPLFQRTGRGIRLTPAGDLVYDYAVRIFALAEEMEGVLEDLRGVIRGRLSIGASTTIGEYFLPELIGRFKDSYPGVEVEMRVANTREVVDDVRRHGLDLGFIGGRLDDGHLVIEHFATDEIVLFASSRHRLAGKMNVQIGELGAEGFIAREKGSATRLTAEECLRELGLAPQVRMELGSNEAVKRAVSAGLGIGMLSRSALTVEVDAGILAQLDVPAFRCTRQLSLIYRRDKRLTSAEQAFLATIHS